MIITIDGPVASGKTTVGKLLAERLGFDYLYSGFLYRAVAYVLLEYGNYAIDVLPTLSIDLVDKILEVVAIEYCFIENGNCRVLINNNGMQEDLLMTQLMDRASSMLGLNSNLRSLLTAIQRKLVVGRNVIVDGRDAGSVVFPQAAYKFFLTASVSVRVQRYIKRQEKLGKVCSVKDAENIITERDMRDGHWLTAVHDMHDIIKIDTSFTNQKEVVNTIIQQLSLNNS